MTTEELISALTLALSQRDELAAMVSGFTASEGALRQELGTALAQIDTLTVRLSVEGVALLTAERDAAVAELLRLNTAIDAAQLPPQ